MRRAGAATGLVLAAALALSGCGGDDPKADPSPSAGATSASSTPSAATSPSATPTSYLPVPAGTTLTEQGSGLTVGAAATVAWEPRQDTVGVLGVTVDAIERTSLKRSFVGWKIPEQTRTATPYFVRATITNAGATDLSGRAVPLYVLDGTQTLIEATSFASTFKPCHDGALPDAFTPGASAQVCLVYFVPEPGELAGVSFRPTQEFNPITWTGTVGRAPKAGAAG